LISKVAVGRGVRADLDRMISLSQLMVDSSNCALGMSPYFFIKTTIERFADEYQAHLDGKCPLGVCKGETHH
jgi:NADH-quinone oxidoreductase subunit F